MNSFITGIFPREPKNKKKANKGSSAPTSFYYAKDIAYLAHEPVLQKLREHKAFAKKLSRALGRGEWSSAKSLEDNKPVYRLDHIIKERCAFIDRLRLTFHLIQIDTQLSLTQYETLMMHFVLSSFLLPYPLVTDFLPPSLKTVHDCPQNGNYILCILAH